MKKVFRVLANKYFIASVAFLAWTIYFDQNDYVSLQLRQKELNGLKNDIAYLNKEIASMDAERNDLLTNPQKLEQYARERFHMKHEGEDVYVVDNGSSTSK